MVVEILETTRFSSGPLQYNEKKVFRSQASVLSSRGVEYGGVIPIRRTFQRYESNPAIDPRTKKLVMHLAFSPSEKDNPDETALVQFVEEYLDRIEYGKQPYVLYRHDDIARCHYHLVTPRVNEKGRVILNNFEGGNWDRPASMRLVAEIGPKYGFYPAEKKERIREIEREPDLHPDEPVRKQLKYDPTARRQTDDLRYLYREALKFDFVSREEFAGVLRTMRLLWPDRKGQEDNVRLQGCDSHGVKATKVIPFERNMEFGAKSLFDERLAENVSRHRNILSAMDTDDYDRMDLKQRIRISAMLTVFFRDVTSWEQMRKRCAEAGFTLLCNRQDAGARDELKIGERLRPISGVTLVDHEHKVSYSGDRLLRIFDWRRFRQAEEEGRWSNVREKPLAYGTKTVTQDELSDIHDLIVRLTDEFNRKVEKRREEMEQQNGGRSIKH